MLSRVLKGDQARQAPAMVFAAAVDARIERRKQPPPGRSPGGEEEAALLARVQALEAELAAAKREAFDAGRLQGEQDAGAVLAPVTERMKASIAEVLNLRPDLRRSAEKDAVALALQIARRVLHRELSVDGNALNALARVIFDRLTRTESWQLTINPRFADSIRGAVPSGSIERVRIDVDPDCAPGTFVVHCTDGTIDASIDSQLAEIGRGLTDRLAGK